MDAFFEQKVAERDRTEASLKFLKREYAKASKTYGITHKESDFVVCTIINEVIEETRKQFKQLEQEIVDAQAELEGTPDQEYQDQLAGVNLVTYNPYAYLKYNRSTMYFYLALTGVVVVAVIVVSVIGGK